jgi:hypothetical protein
MPTAGFAKPWRRSYEPSARIRASNASNSVFETKFAPGDLRRQARNRYVVSPDGQRFLMVIPAGEADPTPLTVVLNWR